MKKALILIGILTGLISILSGCAPQADTTKMPIAESNTTQVQMTEASNQETALIEMTLDELSKFDGKNGNPSYVAVDGTIYDVSELSPWKGGEHQGLVSAGKDLSKDIQSSPHGKSILDQAKKIGTLKQ